MSQNSPSYEGRPETCPYSIERFPVDLYKVLMDHAAIMGVSPDEAIIAAVRKYVAHD
jgi:hypothetical protein